MHTTHSELIPRATTSTNGADGDMVSSTEGLTGILGAVGLDQSS